MQTLNYKKPLLANQRVKVPRRLNRSEKIRKLCRFLYETRGDRVLPDCYHGSPCRTCLLKGRMRGNSQECTMAKSYFFRLTSHEVILLRLEKENPMKSTTTFKHHYIPKNFYKPAMLAIQIYTDGTHRSLATAVDIAIHYYTADPSSKDYIHPSQLKRHALVKHILEWLKSDAVRR